MDFEIVTSDIHPEYQKKKKLDCKAKISIFTEQLPEEELDQRLISIPFLNSDDRDKIIDHLNK